MGFYVKPSVALNYALGEQSGWYARLSAVGSGTYRHDAFDVGDTGRLGLEEAVVGLQLPLSPGGPQRDLSAGAQTFTLGAGMLISNGASNGFSRGALKLGPRKAFRETAIARLHTDTFTREMFYLAPNENSDSSSGTRLAGATITHRPGSDEQAGLAYGRVLRSTAAYPQAAPGGVGVPSIIANAREDLQFLYGFARRPLWESAQSKGWLAVDLAHEWNHRQPLSAWGGRVELGVALPTLRWKPTVTLGYQSFRATTPIPIAMSVSIRSITRPGRMPPMVDRLCCFYIGRSSAMKSFVPRKTTAMALLSLALGATAPGHAAQAEPLDAAGSDPAKLGWMVGAPPPPDKQLRFDDGSYFQFPAMRWSVSHFRQLMPTVNVSRGLGAPVPLPRAMRKDLDAVRFVPLGAKSSMTW